jgi:NTE family protein
MIKAYAILSGGGVKGAALAGGLLAAKEKGYEFVAYGGTSAGSIIALLACVGYSPEELREIMVEEVDFAEFLDGTAAELQTLKDLPKDLKPLLEKLPTAVQTIVGKFNTTLKSNPFNFLQSANDLLNEIKKNTKLISDTTDFFDKYNALLLKLSSEFGLCDGEFLEVFLRKKIDYKLPKLVNKPDITFADLKAQRCPTLKIVASDLKHRRPFVFSALGGDKQGGSVIDAVRASISFPFVFRPVKVNKTFLVDGGLGSNLPLFLFEKDLTRGNLPIVAFDLITASTNKTGKYDLGDFFDDMMTTALESGDDLMRNVLKRVRYIPIRIPQDIGTLDFALEKSKKQQLFTQGHSDAASELSNYDLKPKTLIEQLQAQYASPIVVTSILRAVAKEFEEMTNATKVRTNITLPAGDGTSIIVYQYGMDNDTDCDLILDVDAGCTGRALIDRNMILADLVAAKQYYSSDWKMKRPQQSKVRKDRKAMLAIPIFVHTEMVGLSDLLHVNTPPLLDIEPIGTLAVDTDTALEDTMWAVEPVALELAKQWARVLAYVLR